MYSYNFRSFVRDLLRKEGEKYPVKDGRNIPLIAQAVTEAMRDRELSDDEQLESLYALVYEEARDVFKHSMRPKRTALQMDFLVKLGVPAEHASLLVRIDEDDLPIPQTDGFNLVKPLYGEHRMSRTELETAKAFVRKKGDETIAKADLLDELYKLPGYYA
jgi:hypothetical protein